MPQPRRSVQGVRATFRVFVSSTFTDLVAERDALHDRVFPRLRSVCEERDARFQAIDLRWGVSEAAARDQRTVDICLAEVDRSRRSTPRPNFIVLLGDRYGWRPLPSRIPTDVFARLCGGPAADTRLLRRWYRLDTNARPAELVLQQRAGRDLDDAVWAATEAALHGIIVSRLEHGNDEGRRYRASATELEVLRGALEPPDAADQVFCFLRTIVDLPSDARAAAFGDFGADGRPDLAAARALEALKSELRERLPGRVHEYEARWTGESITEDHVPVLCDDVLTSLQSAISGELERLDEVDPLDVEREVHRTFGSARASDFVGREPELANIEDYAAADERQPLIVVGASGSGKTALMARAAEAYGAGREAVVRFIGATPRSSDARALISDVVRDLAQRLGADDPGTLTDADVVREQLREHLAMATAARPVAVFVDALDQLSSDVAGNELAWLPVELPPHARLIVSTVTGAPFEQLRTRCPRAPLLEVAAMTSSDGGQLLDRWLETARRTLSTAQRREVLARFRQHGLPLQLRLSFEEARRWPSYAPAADTVLEPTIPGLIHRLLHRLSAEGEHGPVLVARSLGFLAAARDGLSEDELLELLSKDDDVMSAFRSASPNSPSTGGELPVVVWSRLYFDLEPYLDERAADGASLLGFYHRQLSEVVASEYLTEEDGRRRHRHLARYFAAQPVDAVGDEARTPNLRRLSELPYQQVLGELWDDAHDTLTDLDFLQRRVADSGVEEHIGRDGERTLTHTGVFLALRDLDLAIRSLPAEHVGALRPLRDVIELSSHVLVPHPAEFRTQLVGRLLPALPGAADILERAGAKAGTPWLCPTMPTLPGPGGPLIRTLTGWAGHVQHLAVTPDGRRVVTGGLDGRLDVWDLETGAHLHDLHRAENAITALAVTPDGGRVVVGAGGGARAVWELESGGEPYTLPPHADSIDAIGIAVGGRVAVSVSSGWSFAGDRARTVLRFWDVATGRQLRTLKDGTRNGSVVGVRSDGRRVLQSGDDFAIEVWDPDDGRRLHVLRAHTSDVRCVAFTSDGRFLLSGGGRPWFEIYEDEEVSVDDDCAIRMWDLDDGSCVGMLRGHTDVVRSIAVSDDGSRAVSASDDHTVRVWDLEALAESNAFVEHTDAVVAVVLTPDGQRAISSSSDNTLRVWEVAATRQHSASMPHQGRVTSIAASPDGAYAVSAADDGKLIVWDLADGSPLRTMACDADEKPVVATSGDSAVVVAAWSGHVTAWDPRSGDGLARFEGPFNPTMVAVDRRGRRAVAIGDGEVVVWDLRRGVEGDRFRARNRDLVMDDLIVLAPDGKTLVYLGDHHTMVVRQVGAGQDQARLRGRDVLNGASAAAVTPDMRRAVLAAGVRTLVWDSPRTRPRHRLTNRTSFVTAAAISADGRLAIIAEDDNALSVWDLEGGRLVHVLVGHTDAVGIVRITGDGRRAVSAARSTLGIRVDVTADRSLCVWDLETGGPPLATFSTDSDVVALAMPQNGGTVVAGDESGRIHVLRLRDFADAPSARRR